MKILTKISWVQAQVTGFLFLFVVICLGWVFFGDHRPTAEVVKKEGTQACYEITFIAAIPADFNLEKYKAEHKHDRVEKGDLQDEGRVNINIKTCDELDNRYYKYNEIKYEISSDSQKTI